jgi:hypothetical protein
VQLPLFMAIKQKIPGLRQIGDRYGFSGHLTTRSEWCILSSLMSIRPLVSSEIAKQFAPLDRQAFNVTPVWPPIALSSLRWILYYIISNNHKLGIPIIRCESMSYECTWVQ